MGAIKNFINKLPMPISVSSGHFALRYEVPKFLARGGHLCMAVLTIAAVLQLNLLWLWHACMRTLSYGTIVWHACGKVHNYMHFCSRSSQL